jgi:hypothetical protein
VRSFLVAFVVDVAGRERLAAETVAANTPKDAVTAATAAMRMRVIGAHKWLVLAVSDMGPYEPIFARPAEDDA